MNAREIDHSLVTLTTDFGLSDSYVGAMKGVLLSINPRLQIVDISHDVRPQAVKHAAFLTQSAWPFFQPEAIHVAIVDPEVGTERRAIAVQTPRGMYVGPDNGVLSSALADDERPSRGAGTVPLPAGCRAVSITNLRYLLEPISATFHGRDVFAPAAAHLSLGVALEAFGEPIEAIVALPPPRAARDGDGSLRGEVIHIDRFGNVITDIRAADAGELSYVVEIGGRIVGPSRTYAEATSLAAVAGSSGYVEIVFRNGSAARELALDVGARAVLRPTDGRR